MPESEAAEVLEDLRSLTDPRRDLNELASVSPRTLTSHTGYCTPPVK
jgi:hypothetical protein